MGTSVNGLSGQYQYPISTSYQPGQQNNQVRSREEDVQPQENTVQPQGTSASEIQSTETGNQDIIRAQQEDSLNSGSQKTAERGSIIDITV